MPLRWPGLVIGAMALLPAGGIEVDIDRRAIDEAASIARESRERVVQAFNDRYVLPLGGPKLARMEIISEFRRAVMLGRTKIEAGNSTWTPNEIERALQPWRGRVSIVADVRFSPLHRLIFLPVYTAVLSKNSLAGTAEAEADAIRPVSLRADPIYPPGAPRDGTTAMQGARLEIELDARALDPNGRYYFTVYEDKERLNPVLINLAEFR